MPSVFTTEDDSPWSESFLRHHSSAGFNMVYMLLQLHWLAEPFPPYYRTGLDLCGPYVRGELNYVVWPHDLIDYPELSGPAASMWKMHITLTWAS